MEKKFGFIEEEARDTDYILGAKQLPTTILQKGGQWGDFLPAFEPQRKKKDVMACVSFSNLNCLETLHYRILGIAYNRSDRFTAKMSNTDPYRGNSMRNVAESVRKDGTVKESLWSYENITSLSQYYKTIPNSIIQKGKDWLKEYSIGYEWIFPSFLSIPQKQQQLMKALQYSPIQVSIYAYGKQKGGIFIEENKKHNHAVVLYGYKKGEYWKLFDSYKNEFKKFAWGYNFKYSLRFSLTKINNKIMIIELYKDSNHHKTKTIYQYSGQAKKLYIPIGDENYVFDNFGDWESVVIKDLGRPLAKHEIGKPLVYRIEIVKSITNMITNIFGSFNK